MSFFRCTQFSLVILLTVSVVLLPSLSKAGAKEMAKTFSEGQFYKGALPTDVGSSDMSAIERGDHSHLTAGNDTTIGDAGLQEGITSDHGYRNILKSSEDKQVAAMSKYNINPEDAMFQKSFGYESAPLKEFGGTSVRRKKTITKETKETCEEGVQFEIDIIRQRVYYPKIVKEDFWTPFEWKKIHFSGSTMWTIDLQNRPGRYYGWCQSVQRVCSGTFVGFMVDGPGQQGFLKQRLGTHLKIQPECFGQIKTQNQGGYQQCYGRGSKDHMFSNYQFDYQIREHKKRTYDAGGREEWVVLTPENEKLQEAQSCHEINRVCLDKGDKVIEGITVNRPCWKEQVTLQCKTDPQQGCQYLMAKGCQHDNSTCLEKFRSICLKWKKEFTCKTSETTEVSEISAPMFCMSGDCFTPELKDNTGMNEAVAYLQLFKEMQADIEKQSVTIFKGEHNQCAKHLVNFTNCCSSMSGWGQSVGLSKCSGEEKALANKREKKLCHYVGTYCADKVLGVCTRKKSSYCCFPSKIGRIFQEQGRGQIGKTWGTSKSPQCEGFTREEMMRLDFSKMNLQEMVQDFVGKADITSQKQIPRQMLNTMPKMQTSVTANPGGSHEF